MNRSKKLKALSRAVAVMSAAVIVAGGVTFAALQSQQDTLTGNSIETATANLQLSTDGITYGNSLPGFDFNNLIPGGPPAPSSGYALYLKNTGNAPLALKLAVGGQPSNPNSVDLTKVNVILTPINGGTPQEFTLQALIDAQASGGLAITYPSELFVGNTARFTVQVSMAADAFSGNSASLTNLDLVFSGLALAS